jgi:hypothetical protein
MTQPKKSSTHKKYQPKKHNPKNFKKIDFCFKENLKVRNHELSFANF